MLLFPHPSHRSNEQVFAETDALVTSKLDYCNSLLYGTVDKNFVSLQCLQNTVARLIMRLTKYTNMTPVLKELRWPSAGRVSLKIMLLVHRAVNCRGPVYLRDLTCIYTPTRSLRSEVNKQLKRPKTKCNTAAFPVRKLNNDGQHWLSFQRHYEQFRYIHTHKLLI